MTKNFPGEQWKAVKFKFDYINDLRMEVSNFGRVRSFGKFAQGNILNGSMTSGYRIVRSKFFTKRDPKKQKEFDNAKLQVLKLSRKIKSLKDNKAGKSVIAEANNRLADLKKTLSGKFRQDEKARTIYHHDLIHRLVATYFLPKPLKNQVVVAHLDHDKLNNRSRNLKWMTLEENYAHQQKSPHVIAEKHLRATSGKLNTTTKLTVNKVMLLKKLLNQNKPVRELAKRFNVTDTQILRIKKGENWGSVKAAN